MDKKLVKEMIWWGAMILVLLGVLFYIVYRDKMNFGKGEFSSVDTGETVSANGVSISSVKVVLSETFPVKATLVVNGFVPDSCTSVDRVRFLGREGNVFRYEIVSSRPDDALCAQVLSNFTVTEDIDVEGLEKGVYKVIVNGSHEAEFELLEDNVFSNFDKG